MAFTIISSESENYLSGQPRVVLASPSAAGVTTTLSFTVTETDAVYALAPVTVVLDWRNGSAPTEYSSPSGGVVNVTSEQLLPVGSYNVLIYARNSRFPTPDSVLVQVIVEVQLAQPVVAPANLVYGPILPLDSGAPSAKDWSFNRSTDLQILESSVKMLLSTAIGERIMLPEYGTNLRTLLFEPNLSGIEALAQHEVITALQKWEPRVKLSSISVTRNNNREVYIALVLTSMLSNETLETNLAYTL